VIVIVKLFFVLLVVLLVIDGNSVLDALGQTVAVERLSDVLVLSDRGEQALVDGLAGIGLLHDAQHAVVEMLVEFLCVGKGDGASGTSSGNVGLACICFAAARTLLAAVGWILLDTVNRCEVTLEHVGAVKALLRSRSASRTEAANHGSLVVSKCVAVLVVLACEALDVVFACGDWAFLGPLVLVCEHVCLQVLEDASAFGKRAKTLLSALVVQSVAATTLAACTRVLRMKGCDGAPSLAVELWVGVILLSAKIRACTALLYPC
jgi:hypothetical protein